MKAPTAPRPRAGQTVLLVDDSRVQRRILRALVAKWGYSVLEAASGAEALEICADSAVDFIISDWMMPGMNGIEFCKRFRASKRASYGYFILLTSKSETGEIVNGLEVGADDFLTKPVNSSELRARLKSGERVLRMEQELHEKNKLIGAALDELQGLYDTIDRDLIQARKIQESLVPDRFFEFGPTTVSMLMKPCGHVGGDLVGAFSPGPNRLAFYNIDVSGHGITSALMTARLAGYLSGKFLEQNIAVEKRFSRFFALLQPNHVARVLNERLLSDTGVEEYFTMVYGIADLTTGHLRMVQAGHPHPMVQRADGSVEFIGAGGVPVGLVSGAEYQCFDVTLSVGDRILICSDGFTEAECDDGQMLEEEGLEQLLCDCGDSAASEVLDDMFWRLTQRRTTAPLNDDVSAVLLEYGGPEVR
ncbi:PP2C family protein-serine/threonine phosphatase [Actibacterium lipolyticum]|uniref:Alkaline phosphatase synthesis transcriptional regulatory protein PhoP n=1 Tax=Actibacterium lipolyticum TaxID=1524263 RepID=A0A238KW40_9RHOB|nr:SpoIIE family protein phosphatase [Actibacterium lipolyticum]SMX47033.1 Alkaline phosphatase synthesis transcriptional regulatory protein PhoP [Actibacterium lipolyticum]